MAYGSSQAPEPRGGLNLCVWIGRPKKEGEHYRWWFSFHINKWDFDTNSFDYFWWETQRTKLGCRISREALLDGFTKGRWSWRLFRWGN